MRKEYAIEIIDFVKDLCPELEPVKLAANEYGFAYLPSYPAILIPTEKDIEDYAWETWMYEYLVDEYDLPLCSEEQMDMFCLLHEIGHHMNRHMYDADAYREAVNDLDDTDYLAYRQIPDEYMADTWAVIFMKEHIDELTKILNEFN